MDEIAGIGGLGFNLIIAGYWGSLEIFHMQKLKTVFSATGHQLQRCASTLVKYPPRNTGDSENISNLF